MNGNDSVKHPGLDNHVMGTIFEELVRRFNEENNEEAGEHWTPRDAVKLMARLIFLPIANHIESSTYLLYDGACGTGGMLTVAEEELKQLAQEHGKQVATHLYGQEINAETYAIAKADLLLKGEGDAADNLVGGPEYSTLSNDAFPARKFDFMLSNPPYGKSWKSDLERMGGKDGIKDPRFIIEHEGDSEYSLITRSSDGQMMFLVNMLSKMKPDTRLGSRIAEVHNGSSLFTGDAGQGESNIRRWIIENDWLEAIVSLPLNMFYNTGIATYIWVLSNRKPENRKGKVQLVDATQWYRPLRKNLGKKNCELSEEDIQKICDTFLAFEESEQSKIFPNAAFGYWKVTVERPLRLAVDLSSDAIASFRKACTEAGEEQLVALIDKAAIQFGPGPHNDFNTFLISFETMASKAGVKLTAKKLKLLQNSLAKKDESSVPVIKKVHKPGKVEADPLNGRFETTVNGKLCVVEYEPDTELRDTEQVPLLEEGGIEAFIRREVLPHAVDAWIDENSIKIGYEISFTRYFYKPQPLRSLDEIRADILALEKETDGLLDEIIGRDER
jgi:type I restriction enzyme M protein